MIPVVLPIAIAALTFMALTAAAYVVFAGADGLLRLAQRTLPGTLPEEMAPESSAAVSISPAATGAAARVEGYYLPESLYYHQGHAWVALQKDGTALVGIDDFAGKLIGKLSSITLPRVGERRRQGEKGWRLSRNEKSLDMLFPMDGKIVAVNERAVENPATVSEEPYGAGWLMMIKPRDIKRNLRNLLRGSAARSWMENSAAEFRSAFSGELGVVYQDGGLPEEGAADHFTMKDWIDVTARIFMIEPEDSGR